MMRRSKLLLASFAGLLIILTNQSLATADIVFSVEVDPVIDAGDATSVTFFATSTLTGGQTLSGFNLPVDLNGGGNGSAEIFTNLGISNLVGGSASLNPAELQNTISASDVIANISNGDGFLVTTDTPLFNLLLTTDSGLGVGSFPVEISTAGLFSVTAQSGADLTGTSTVFTNPDGSQGSVNITAAVPEPSSLALLIGVFGLAGMKRQRS